ncbi:RNA polymerase sigma factor [Paenibacillus sediminis]|uniref:RNA polymerase sigma factor n=1 Tax=Paenibacillus sediminis TaxID=664909 RepID=UPI0031583F2B
MQAVLSGHRDEYSKLVARYHNMVYRVCLKMTRDEESAKDLAQEVFMKAYRALPTFREQSSFSTWLYQISVRRCLDFKRVNDREWRHRSSEAVSESHIVSLQTPEDIVLSKDTSLMLHKMLDELAEPYKSVVKLHYFHQYSYQEIANETGATVRTVESQLYRAKQMMRKRGADLR